MSRQRDEWRLYDESEVVRIARANFLWGVALGLLVAAGILIIWSIAQ